MRSERIALRLIQQYGLVGADQKARQRVYHHQTRTRDHGWLSTWCRVVHRIGVFHFDSDFDSDFAFPLFSLRERNNAKPFDPS